ncbi:crossover junction endodeoxyribonuclease RuvC [Phnomibacter sp. MR]|uniref:crossover junction endodeoxyribonuclease RuvC n=1 Tax=Phnomibacter sp. MR TaxID=3042318 RepID=UPI003A7F75FD
MATQKIIPSSTVILGVDPGTVVMGYSVIRCTGQKIEMMHMGTLNMSWEHDVFERLQRIYKTMDEVIRQFQPQHFAIEAPFFGKNVQSMLKLGRAQGVAIACAMQHNLAVTEYSPKKVKMVVTGNGNAEKEQVWGMLQRLLQLTEKPKGFDASDALAVAVCHHYQQQSPLAGLTNKSKGWEDFLKKNPERVSAGKLPNPASSLKGGLKKGK